MSTSHALRLLTGLATGAAVLVALLGVTAAQQPGTPTIKTVPYNAIVSVEGAPAGAASKPGAGAQPVTERQAELKQQALEDSGVQAMLDVFAADIKDVEER